MPYYAAKCQSGNFDPNQPNGFRVITAIENRFFVVECDDEPVAESVTLIPDDIYVNIRFHHWPNGKKVLHDPFPGEVARSEEVDSKGRRTLQYTDAQLVDQLNAMKWLMLNIWLVDKAKMLNVPPETVTQQQNEISALADPDSARTYLKKQLYYNL